MKRFRIIALILALLMLISITVACSEKNDLDNDTNIEDINQKKNNDLVENDDFPVEVEDKFGNKEVLDKEPMRIISLAPSNTEILFALGLGDRVVGVTSFCDYPEEAKSKEIVGDYSGHNLERIIELEPDLVLVYGPGDEEENIILRDAGIKVLGFMSETMDEIMRDI